MKILNSTWWTPNTRQAGAVDTACIGAVAVEVQGGWKAYIGLGNGWSEEGDAIRIADSGAKMSEDQARGCFPQYADMEYIH